MNVLGAIGSMRQKVAARPVTVILRAVAAFTSMLGIFSIGLAVAKGYELEKAYGHWPYSIALYSTAGYQFAILFSVLLSNGLLVGGILGTLVRKLSLVDLRRYSTLLAIAIVSLLALTDTLLYWFALEHPKALGLFVQDHMVGIATPHLYCLFVAALVLAFRFGPATSAERPRTIVLTDAEAIGAWLHLLAGLGAIVLTAVYVRACMNFPFGFDHAASYILVNAADRIALLMVWTVLLPNAVLGAGVFIALAICAGQRRASFLALTLAACGAILVCAADLFVLFAADELTVYTAKMGHLIAPGLIVPCAYCVLVFLWMLLPRSDGPQPYPLRQCRSAKPPAASHFLPPNVL